MLLGDGQEEKYIRSILLIVPKMSQENNNPNSGNRSQSNGGNNGNQRKQRCFKYSYFRSNNKSKNGNSNASNANKLPTKREFKFYMHDSRQQKNAELFERIKGTIIMKIQESFEDPLYVTESLEKSVKKVF